MSSITSTTQAIFFPKKPDAITLKNAANAHQHQRLARITKAALFVIAALSTTFTLLLIDAATITWSAAFPAIAVTLAVGTLFFRLNSLDQHYVKHFDDEARAQMLKKKLETLFYETRQRTDQHVRRNLVSANLLLGKELFTRAFISKMIELNQLKTESKSGDSLAEIAQKIDVNLSIEYTDTWKEYGRFGLPDYDNSFDFKWKGSQNSPIEIVCKKSEASPENYLDF